MTNDIYSQLHPMFRGISDTKYTHELPKEFIENGKRYVRVKRVTERHPNNVKHYFDQGYKLCYFPGSEVKKNPNSIKEKDNLYPDPVRVVSERGEESYWMWIEEELYQSNQRKLDAELMATVERQSVRTTQPGQVTERDRQVLNLENFQPTSDTDI